MNKILLSKKFIIFTLIGLISFIFFNFMSIDLSNKGFVTDPSAKLKYSAVLLCFITSLFIGKNGYDEKDKLLLHLGLLLTAIADYFLVILAYSKMGILVFCLVQGTYIIRHSRNIKFRFKFFLPIPIFYILLIFTILKSKGLVLEKGVVFLSVTYGFLLVSSLIIAVTTYKRNFYSRKNSIIIALALILFFLCDTNVALLNIFSRSSLTLGSFYLKNIFSILIWIFYTPSQLLLALSGYKLKGTQQK